MTDRQTPFHGHGNIMIFVAYFVVFFIMKFIVCRFHETYIGNPVSRSMERIRADIKKNCIIREMDNKHEVTIKIPEQANIKQKEVKVIMFYVTCAHNEIHYYRGHLSPHCTKPRRYWQIPNFRKVL